MATPDRFYVGPVAAFKDKSRQLVKCGERNVAVYRYKDKFYAIDNACYHHGGPLLEGDIEEMGGHPCVVCPWHAYHITLDTGECLYWALKMSPSGVPDRRAPQYVCSKGKKQRTHIVTLEDGEVYVTLNTSGTPVDSDAYAEMPIANKERTMNSPLEDERRKIHPTSGGVYSGFRSGRILGEIGAGKRPRLGAAQNRPVVMCVKIESVCDNTKEFFFNLVQGELNAVALVPGQYVDLELPLAAPPGRTSIRRWTVTDVTKDNSLFTLVIKASSNSQGGSAWMLNSALYQRFPLVHCGGNFTLYHNVSSLRAVEGRVVMLSAGIGVTPLYASLHFYFERGGVSATIPRLHVIHLHVDRRVSSVAKLEEFVRWNYTKADHFTYSFHCYLTEQQEMPADSEKENSLQSLMTCGRRPDEKDMRGFLGEFLGKSPAVLAMVCGPPAFISAGKQLLISSGVPGSNVLTDENDGYNSP